MNDRTFSNSNQNVFFLFSFWMRFCFFLFFRVYGISGLSWYFSLLFFLFLERNTKANQCCRFFLILYWSLRRWKWLQRRFFCWNCVWYYPMKGWNRTDDETTKDTNIALVRCVFFSFLSLYKSWSFFFVIRRTPGDQWFYLCLTWISTARIHLLLLLYERCEYVFKYKYLNEIHACFSSFLSCVFFFILMMWTTAMILIHTQHSEFVSFYLFFFSFNQ